jgi:hypothetical protein
VSSWGQRGVWLAGVLLCGGCYRTTVTTKTVESQRTERRVPLDEASPLLRSRWQIEPDEVVGQLDLQTCQTTRAWTVTKTRTTDRKPQRELPWLGLGVGAAFAIGAAATYDSHAQFYCDGQPQTEPVVSILVRDPNSCHFESPDNTVPQVLAVSSLLFLSLAVVAGLQKGDRSREVLDETRHGAVATEPCLGPRDLQRLLLVVRGPTGQLWPVRLSADGQARIPLPQSPELPRGVDLELVVYREPRFDGGLLKRGRVLDTFRLPRAEH